MDFLKQIVEDALSDISCADALVYVDVSSGYTCYDCVNELLWVQIKCGPNAKEIEEIKTLLTVDGETDETINVPAPEIGNSIVYAFDSKNKVDNVQITAILEGGKVCGIASSTKPKSCDNSEEPPFVYLRYYEDRGG